MSTKANDSVSGTEIFGFIEFVTIFDDLASRFQRQVDHFAVVDDSDADAGRDGDEPRIQITLIDAEATFDIGGAIAVVCDTDGNVRIGFFEPIVEVESEVGVGTKFTITLPINHVSSEAIDKEKVN